MSSKKIASEHPDLDEIVEVSVSDGIYSARVQVTAEAFEENGKGAVERASDLGAGLEIVHVDERTSNITFYSADSDTMRSCLDFIADTFITYDDSMQDALRRIDLDAA